MKFEYLTLYRVCVLCVCVCVCVCAREFRLVKIKEWVDKRDPNALLIPFSAALELKVCFHTKTFSQYLSEWKYFTLYSYLTCLRMNRRDTVKKVKHIGKYILLVHIICVAKQ